MEITTETVITGTETLIEDAISVFCKVEVKRTNNNAFISLMMRFKDTWKFIDGVGGYEKTFEESLNKALSKARDQWQIEVNLKEVA